MKVADFWSIRVWRVICGIKLFVNILSKNWFTPVICLYFIRFKLKLPTIELLLFSRLILLNSCFIKSLLNLKCCMLRCLYVVPNIELVFLGIRISSIKTDSSSLGLCICKSSCTLYDLFEVAKDYQSLYFEKYKLQHGDAQYT